MAKPFTKWIEWLHTQNQSADQSLLADLFALFRKTSPLHISFEDLSGVARDIPPLQLSSWDQQHTCRFCLFAKWNPHGSHDCEKNKYAVNRLVLRKMAGFHGQCHLGLTDIVEPLIFHDRILGIFYFGSVMVQGTEKKARQRIVKYCQRRNLRSQSYFSELKAVPVISRKELKEYQERLKFATRLVTALLDSWGLPKERYQAEIIGPLWADPKKRRALPFIVRSTIRYVHAHYAEDLQVAAIAKLLSTHPVFLSRTFKKAMECNLGEYIQRVRIDHARQRLKGEKQTITEIGYEVGFQEKSHFGRTFKKFTGLSPGEYRRQQTKMAPPAQPGV